MSFAAVFLQILLSSTAPILSLALDLPGDLVDCKELSCPKTSAHYDTCTVGDNTFEGVGLARIPNLPDPLAGVSLVKGVNVSRFGIGQEGPWEENRAFKSVYYLGTPSALSIEDISGCAVFFHDMTMEFEGGVKSGRGTCPDVIAAACITSLTDRALAIARDGVSEANVCSALHKSLRYHRFEECIDLAGRGNGLGRFDITSLSSISTIDTSQNSSSDCWPIVPKCNNLAVLASFETQGDFIGASIFDEVYMITPVLTVFFAGEGALGLEKSVSQMTCVKVVTPEQQQVAFEGAAFPPFFSWGSYSLVVVFLFICMVSMMV